LGTWRSIGILSKIITGSVNGDLSELDVYRLLRNRTRNPVFQKRMLEHLIAKDRPWLLYQYCKAVLDASHPQVRPHFANAMRQAEARL
jgi:hypothetical protein